jgi:hypothetical protein
MTEPTEPYVTEPLPPLSDYAILLQRLAAHLQVVAGLLHDLAEYDPSPVEVRKALGISIGNITAQFSFMDSSNDPQNSPEVQRALANARARTTASILAQANTQVEEFKKEAEEKAEAGIEAGIEGDASPLCSICGSKMGMIGWDFAEEESTPSKTFWFCPQECLPELPAVFQWHSFLDATPDESHSPFYEWED